MPQVHRFGLLEVRPTERQVLRAGQPVALDSRAFDLLWRLVEHRDRVVPRAELLNLPGGASDEDALVLQISALRRALGSLAIATVEDRGYRFTLAAGDADHEPAAASPPVFTYLFTDIEDSTRLWEQQAVAMRPVLAEHDAQCRQVVARHDGIVIKTTGDGVHAAFTEARAALAAAIELQGALSSLTVADGQPLRVRMGLHAGSDEHRDGDFFGPAVNRAVRVMDAAHGGQILLSHAVVVQIGDALPPQTQVRELGLVRLRDLASSERIFQVEHPELRREFPALRSLEVTPNNLPQQLNSFVGRKHEMAEVAELLSQQRLVTLLAMGGIGKSRLAVQLGAHLLDSFPDGVWLIELASVTDPSAVPQALASVIGVREEPGASLTETLLRYLGERQLLVLLDNCEHLVDACAQLTKTLLQGTTGVKVLATSRDPLNIAGEMSYPLRPLAIPAAGEARPDELMRHESVRLFFERAQAVQPLFRLEGENAAPVAEICSRLDGIPLALELAAARVRVLTPQAIAGRLDQRFKLLVAGDRTVLPRQRTLRALIDWSYDLLTPRERTLFARLSVFAGGCTLEAAEAVGGGGEIEAGEVLDLLTSLVDKSLVTIDVESGRYRMLDTVRHYAAERLASTDDERATRERHLAYFAAIVEQARPQLFGAEQARFLALLDAERENTLSAHAWCEFSPKGAALDLQLVFCLSPYWANRGLLVMGLRMAQEALGRPGAEARNLARCRGLSDAGLICYYLGRYEEARDLLDESLSIASEFGHEARLVVVLQSLSVVEFALGESQQAIVHGEEAVKLVRATDVRNLPPALSNLALFHRAQGAYAAALQLYDEALAVARTCGNHEVTAIVLLNQAMTLIAQDRGDAAKPLLEEALAIEGTTGSLVVGQSLMEVCSGLAAARGDWDICALLYGAAEAQAARSGFRRDPADAKFLTGAIRRSREASDLSGPAEKEGRAMSYKDALRVVRSYLLLPAVVD